jgi:alginate O-acetyltransferase complex protein AlgF
MKNLGLKTFAIASLVLAAASHLSSVSAGDDGLYEKPLDPNAAFVRIVMPGNASASIMGNQVALQDSGISPYYIVTPGTIAVTTGMGDLTLETMAGKFYSILPGDGKPASVEDELNTNPAKAILSVYNLSDGGDIDVFVPQAKVEAIKDMGSKASKSVALKAPLTLDLVVRSNGKDMAKIDAVEFKRLSGVSIVVTGSGDAIKAVALANTIVK